MWPLLVAIAIIVILAGLFVFLHIKNTKIAIPEGCEELKNDACQGCKLADKCKMIK